MSNEDVKDIQLQRTGRFFKKVGRGIWGVVSFPFRALSSGSSPAAEAAQP